MIGSGGHAISCADIIEESGSYKIVGIVTEEGDHDQSRLKYKRLGSDSDLVALASKYKYAFIGLGQIKAPEIRRTLFQIVKDLDFSLPSIISKDSLVSHKATIGAGTIVMKGAIVNSGAVIGENCIINSGAIIEHGVVIQENCHISTGAVVNGDVNVGLGSFLGSGSCIKEGTTIGNFVVVGMGVNVRRNLHSNETFLGTPK
jgi:sugar O-acyltransferase (sialic acid O-acetyltransferase NeuD family)